VVFDDQDNPNHFPFITAHTVWFVHPFDHPQLGRQDASTIIQAIGKFSRDIQCPARMGARIAQAFSSTDLAVTATAQEVIKIPDIERNGSCFTDGAYGISGRSFFLNHLRFRRRNNIPRVCGADVEFTGQTKEKTIVFRTCGISSPPWRIQRNACN
jgi:hypothetical protein